MLPVKQKTIRHYNDPGHAHFLTFSCNKNLPLLNSDRTRHWFIEALKNVKDKYNYELWAYVIMPEHVHLIVFPLLPDYNISDFLKALKQSVSRKAKHFLLKNDIFWLNKLTFVCGKKQVFRFWQSGPGYDRNIHSKTELLEKLNYIHNNPVKRELVQTPAQWKWSSAEWYEGNKDSLIEIDDFTFYSFKEI